MADPRTSAVWIEDIRTLKDAQSSHIIIHVTAPIFAWTFRNVLGVRSYWFDDDVGACCIGAVTWIKYVFCTAFQGDCEYLINCVFAWWTSVSHGVVSTGFWVKSCSNELSLNQGKITTVHKHSWTTIIAVSIIEVWQTVRKQYPMVQQEIEKNDCLANVCSSFKVRTCSNGIEMVSVHRMKIMNSTRL